MIQYQSIRDIHDFLDYNGCFCHSFIVASWSSRVDLHMVDFHLLISPSLKMHSKIFPLYAAWDLLLPWWVVEGRHNSSLSAAALSKSAIERNCNSFCIFLHSHWWRVAAAAPDLKNHATSLMLQLHCTTYLGNRTWKQAVFQIRL